MGSFEVASTTNIFKGLVGNCSAFSRFRKIAVGSASQCSLFGLKGCMQFCSLGDNAAPGAFGQYVRDRALAADGKPKA